MKRFPHYLQYDAMDCGPTCLRMIAKYYGKNYSLQTLRERSFITREGVSMLGICDAAESIGFRTLGVRLSLKQLHEDMPLPCVLHWNQNHFVELHDIRKTGWLSLLYFRSGFSTRKLYRKRDAPMLVSNENGW